MPQTVREQAVHIPPTGLAGDLFVPAHAKGIIIFAHGSGSSRHSPRNRHVARALQDGGFGTLLLDLLTNAEEEVDLRTRHLRFDIALLSGRLLEATDWVKIELGPQFSIGYFGASTGGGAALVAAIERPAIVKAVVSRGGRPDLAGPTVLRRVHAATLFIVGGEDHQVIDLNQAALAEMQCEKELSIVPGATHLFEEPGTLEHVATLARDWFNRYMTPHSTGTE